MEDFGKNQVRIELDHRADSSACETVNGWLREYNWNKNPKLMKVLNDPNATVPLNLIARLGETVVGGLLGFTQSKWLRIDVMSVDPTSRLCGIGTSLIREAERIGISRGCEYSYVDTMEHQAPDFYLRCGYVVSAKIADWDSFGNSKLFFTRQLGSGYGGRSKDLA